MGKVLVNTRSARLAGKPGLRSRCALLWQKPHAGGHLGFAGQALYRDSAAMRAAQNALLFEADEVLADGSIGDLQRCSDAGGVDPAGGAQGAQDGLLELHGLAGAERRR